MSGMIRKIGLTGGIASGKSSVAVMLAASLDCRRIDVDKICRALFEPGAAGWRQFCRAGGDGMMGRCGFAGIISGACTASQDLRMHGWAFLRAWILKPGFFNNL